MKYINENICRFYKMFFMNVNKKVMNINGILEYDIIKKQRGRRQWSLNETV